MTGLLPFLGILAAVTLGAISPGPSFVFVARSAVALSRAEGLAAALGMGIGGVGFAALALLGLLSCVASAYPKDRHAPRSGAVATGDTATAAPAPRHRRSAR